MKTKSFLLFALLLILISSKTFAQRTKFYKATGLGMGLDYHMSEYLKSLGTNIDYYHIFNHSRFGISFGLNGGAAWGKYGNDLTDSYVESYAVKEMQGDTYLRFTKNTDTELGWFMSGNFTLKCVLSPHVFIGMGPRFNYFSKQDYSVYVTSEDADYIYTDNITMPYREGMFVPGIQFSMEVTPLAIGLRYSFMKIPNNLGNMHMIGFTYYFETTN